MHSTKLIALLVVIMLGSSSISALNNVRQTVMAPEATLSINEEFLNAFLDSMFANLKPPSAPLAITAADRERGATQADAGCPSAITLQREESGVRTSVKLEQGKIVAPMAFSGSYNSTLLGCVTFRGWASTLWELEFDRNRQALLARVRIQDLQLTNVPALAGGSLVKIVQTAFDERINPIGLLTLDQLSPRVPIAPAQGALRLRAKDVRSEIVPGSLRLHITYEVNADK